MNILCKDFDAASYWRFDLPFSFQLGDVIQKCTKPLLLQNVIKFLFYPGKKVYFKVDLRRHKNSKKESGLCGSCELIDRTILHRISAIGGFDGIASLRTH